MEELRVRFYTSKELPREIRGSFRFEEDPYLMKEGSNTYKYLLDLEVIHYRDSKHSAGIILAQHVEGDLAYLSDVILDVDSFTVAKWNFADTFKGKQRESEVVKQRGDVFAWLIWNKPGTLTVVADDSVIFR